MFASALVGDSEEEFEDEEMNVDSEDVDVDLKLTLMELIGIWNLPWMSSVPLTTH